ncbi:hypothetical protein HU200_018088 [Digitaria exilis]|uniref:Secreted protein n=1 Tax=Digitaria exilis TaxID=1010633 RepID=A0A835KJC3_9POAL|nr:hypothetical protein HU200_018088 [Digitaria exilis]CAB3500689.1 unnamed protein product [Digitaria exilis]
MARVVHYLTAASFLVLVMISSNTPTCQACIGRWCRPTPCFPVTNMDYSSCQDVCEYHGYKTNRAYLKRPKRGSLQWSCCCPPPRSLVY